MCKIKAYQVWGDMIAEKSSEAYPIKDLCEDCVSSYEVISTESPMGNICEDCGCEDDSDKEELLNRKQEIEDDIQNLKEQISDLQQELDEINEQIES